MEQPYCLGCWKKKRAAFHGGGWLGHQDNTVLTSDKNPIRESSLARTNDTMTMSASDPWKLHKHLYNIPVCQWRQAKSHHAASEHLLFANQTLRGIDAHSADNLTTLLNLPVNAMHRDFGNAPAYRQL